MNWKLKLGNFLFEHRSFTPLPVILAVFIIFKPVDMGNYNIILTIAGLVISLFGELIRVLAVGYSYEGTSGRESYLRAENVNTTGIYSIVRNPLYIGNYFMFAGIVMVFSNIYALLVFSLFLMVQYYFVILAEENYLKGQYPVEYKEYCRRVRRTVPRFDKYTRNRNRFNVQKVLFKENDSLFNLLVMFLLVLLYKDKTLSGKFTNLLWVVITFSILLVSYIAVKILKKKNNSSFKKESK